MKIDIQKPVDNALKALKQQQRQIIVSRFELDGKKKRSLQSIADDFQLTRERVRQIQVSAIDVLRNDECITKLSKTIKKLEDTLEECGGVANEDYICSVCDLASKKEKGYARLLLEIGESFNKQKISDDISAFWYIDKKKKEDAENTLKKLHKELTNNMDTIYSQNEISDLVKNLSARNIKNKNEYNALVDISLILKKNNQGEWGHYKNPQISLKGISGYISLVLRNSKEPLHFEEISRRVSKLQGKKCFLGSCHNELVRRKQFFLVGRGLYVMEGMGYKEGTIADILIETINESGPITKEEAIKIVGEKRLVKDKSIIQNLLNKKHFTKNKEGRYILVV